MASMLEVLREYKHLAAQKKTAGALAPALQTRLDELESLVKAERARRKGGNAPDLAEDSTAEDTIALDESVLPSPRSPSRAPVPRRASGRADRPPSLVALPIPATQPAPMTGSGPTPAASASAERETPVGVLAPNLVESEFIGSWAWGGVALLFSLGLVLALAGGLAANGGMVTLATVFAVVGIGAWLFAYPGLMAWRELASRRSSAHLSEPDFRATTPVVEPVVAVLTALAAVLWLMLGGLAEEGLPRLLGYLAGLGCWLGALGWATSMIGRPIAARYARRRAFVQYLRGGAHAFEKKNTKRARRLFEMALIEAATVEEETQAAQRLEEAFKYEADELRMRGRDDRADDMMRTYRRTVAHRRRSRPAPRPAPTRASSVASPPSPASDLPTAGTPRVLQIGQVQIHRGAASPSDRPEVREVAAQLSARGRHREAVEQLVTAGLAIPVSLARAGAQEYIQQGLLRSADALYDALDEPQIPEFYKAVAVEWSRQEGTPPEPAFRLAKLLEKMGELEVAARISCQGVLSGRGTPQARRNLGDLAVELCKKLGQDPPPEVLESVELFVAAGDAYRRAGNDVAARRCYETLAERLLAQPDQHELLIPVLSRMFKLDKFLDDRFMAPLVEDVVENGTHGPQAMRILISYRARHRNDHRITIRLFELLVQEGELDEALKLLREMSATGSDPDSLLKNFEILRRKFPNDVRVEVGYARSLIKASRIQDAAVQLARVLPKVRDSKVANEVVGLTDAVFEWGHPDPELRKITGQMLARLGDVDGAMMAFEQYVEAGGRDPDAVAAATDLMAARLAHDSGAPNHAVHLRLARFYLAAGSPQEGIPYLEVARASADVRVEADLLLARAEVAASNPRRAVQVIRDAIDGRHPRDTPELHYELARVYDVLGDRKKARQIDHALQEYASESVRAYQESRPALEKRDTEWMQSLHDDAALEAPPDTDVGGAVAPAGSRTQVTRIEEDDSYTLEEALAPRYKLTKRIGAGGMGDVHLARDEMLGRPVAIKVLRRTLATDLFIAKFKEEARIVAKLSHPGIVSVYDIGQKSDWSYIVMEYVRGPNLSDLVNASSPPSQYDIIQYIAFVADAMAYAHEQGVIHRDLKPANILVGQDGKVKVTDFGIAHVLQGDGQEQTAFSAAGLQVGTVNYMAPEQLRGQPIDGRTDIYLLGTTLYYTLCRRYPFMGEAVAVRKLREDPFPLTRYVPDLSAELDECVRHCIAREPVDRFQKMEVLAAVLRSVPEAQPTYAS